MCNIIRGGGGGVEVRFDRRITDFALLSETKSNSAPINFNENRNRSSPILRDVVFLFVASI